MSLLEVDFKIYLNFPFSKNLKNRQKFLRSKTAPPHQKKIIVPITDEMGLGSNLWSNPWARAGLDSNKIITIFFCKNAQQKLQKYSIGEGGVPEVYSDSKTWAQTHLLWLCLGQKICQMSAGCIFIFTKNIDYKSKALVFTRFICQTAFNCIERFWGEEGRDI